jgi:hypothetical protein
MPKSVTAFGLLWQNKQLCPALYPTINEKQDNDWSAGTVMTEYIQTSVIYQKNKKDHGIQ